MVFEILTFHAYLEKKRQLYESKHIIIKNVRISLSPTEYYAFATLQ